MRVSVSVASDEQSVTPGVLARWPGAGARNRRGAGECSDRGHTELIELLAILVAMLPADQMSLADVKNRLSEVVERLEREHGRVVITKHGRPAAVVLSIEDLDSLEETLEVLSSSALMNDVREGVTELANSEAVTLSKAQALRLISNR